MLKLDEYYETQRGGFVKLLIKLDVKDDILFVGSNNIIYNENGFVHGFIGNLMSVSSVLVLEDLSKNEQLSTATRLKI